MRRDDTGFVGGADSVGKAIRTDLLGAVRKCLLYQPILARAGPPTAHESPGCPTANPTTPNYSAVSGLPGHYLGISTSNPASAEALRAAEAALTARAEAKQAIFGRAWEQVARLIVGVRDGADPSEVDVRVQWADPSTRSVAAEADAVVKLFSAGLLPADYALARLGYSDDEITAIRSARRVEALDKAGTDLTALVP